MSVRSSFNVPFEKNGSNFKRSVSPAENRTPKRTEVNKRTAVRDKYETNITTGVFEVDFVIPSSLGVQNSKFTERSRTGDHSLYWVLISIAKHAPWVRHVWILANGEVQMPYKLPAPLSIRIVNRCKYMKYCPTKNSIAVLTMVHKIEGLSEHFVQTEDDIILGRTVKPADFFDSNGKPFSWRKGPTWGYFSHFSPTVDQALQESRHVHIVERFAIVKGVFVQTVIMLT